MADTLDPPLRIDWLDAARTDDGLGRVGLTFLPGKHGPSTLYPGRVYRREVDADLATLADANVTSLLLLIEDHELDRWGNPDIVERGARAGVHVERRPIPDGSPPASAEEMREILDWLAAARRNGNVAIACMGGVGRTGTVAACQLVQDGWTADDAIAEVRNVRHPSAVETAQQVTFVRAWEHHRGIEGSHRSGRLLP
jgi:protein-tyrosine phosphatase